MSDIQEKISKLPQWVRLHINTLIAERDQAIKALNRYCDEQSPASFFIEDNVSTGEERGPSAKIRYIQTKRMEVKYMGISLTIQLRDDKIALQWEGDKPREIAFIPRSFQCADLVAKENMR